MDESEDNFSSEDLNNTKSPTIKTKPKKRSLVERELETSLTARVISPIAAEGCSTSRYGRARRQKNENAESDKAVKMKSPRTDISPKSAVTSPVYKMHASNSPIKLDSKKPEPFESQINNIYSENVALSRFGSAEKKISPSKRRPKVYIRKDLIQLKDKDKEAEETVVLIKNMFSPVKSAQKSNRSSPERSLEKHGKRKLSNKETQSVVKTLDFDEKDIKKEDDRNKKDGKLGQSKSEIFELEAKSEYQVGDLAWARMGTYPFWPCIITREPVTGLFVKTKLFGRTVRNILNVTFFGDNGRRSWIADSMLRPFLGQLEFEATRAHFTPDAKKKDPKLYAAFFISERKMPQWLLSVEEAETLLREPKRLRIDILNSMLMKVWPEKVTPKSDKRKKVTRTDSDVSLSESLYDTLFSEADDSKGNDSDRRNKRKQSLDVSEVVTACLDNMAAKTGITKIQKQSHMDRWLLKAKTKTPEKSHFKSLAVPKPAKTSAKTQKPSPSTSQKPYRFRSRHNESQSNSSNMLMLNDLSEASTSSDYKSVSIPNNDVTENWNHEQHNESNITDIISDNKSETNSSNKEILDSYISVFKSALSEAEKQVTIERKNVLNKIKQSIDSDENMPSTSDISGISTSFEISRVDAQSSDKELVESYTNENVSENTDDQISHLIVNTEIFNDIDKSGPITSSPKNSLTDTEVSIEALNDSHAKQDDKLIEKIITDDKPNSNEFTKISDDSTENVCNDNVSDSIVGKNHVIEYINPTIHKSNKSRMDNEEESIVNKKSDEFLSNKNIVICNGAHEEMTQNFRKDKKIKTREKPVDVVANGFIESKKLYVNEKCNQFELNTPNTRSRKLRKSDVNIELESDKSKLNRTKHIDDKMNLESVKILDSQIKSIDVSEYNELKQNCDNINNVELSHKSSVEIEKNDVSSINQENIKIKKKYEGLHKQKDVNKYTLNSKECKYSQAIKENETLNISETKLKDKDFITTPKHVSAIKCDKGDHESVLKNDYNNPAFQKYLELKQDNVMDEHPELSQEEITSYLYKTWQYETKDLIDNKVSGEANKPPAKSSNYKAFDKERGRIKLVRKKPANFTQNKTVLSHINKSPVNGYHKEVKPIIISPKNKIIFLPKKSITDVVKNNISFSDFKFSSTSITAQAHTPHIIENNIGVSSVSTDKVLKTVTVTDTEYTDSELTSVAKVENDNRSLLSDNKVQMSQSDKKSNDINTLEKENKLLIPGNRKKSNNDSSTGEKSIIVPQSPKTEKSENSLGTSDTHAENKANIYQNGLELITLTKPNVIDTTTSNKDAKDQKLTRDHDEHAIKVTRIPACNTTAMNIEMSKNVKLSMPNNRTETNNSCSEGYQFIMPQSPQIQKGGSLPQGTGADNNKCVSLTENEAKLSQNGLESLTYNTDAKDQKLIPKSDGHAIEAKATKMPVNNSATAIVQTLENVNLTISENIVSDNGCSAGDKLSIVPQLHKIKKSESLLGTTAEDNQHVSLTDSEVKISQNILETPTSIKPNELDTSTITTKATTAKAENYGNVKETKPDVENNSSLCQETLSSVKNNFSETEIQRNGRLTKNKQRKLKISLTRSNKLDNYISSNASNKVGKSVINISNSILQNGNDISDSDNASKTNKGQLTKQEFKDNVTCPTETLGEENVKPSITSIHRNDTELSHINKDVECKENNNITEKVSFTSDKAYVDISTENDKLKINLGAKENIEKDTSKDKNETVLSILMNTESISKPNSPIESIALNPDEKEEIMTSLVKNNVSMDYRLTTTQENTETILGKKDGLTEINSDCSFPSKQQTDNSQENPEFLKYLELKQDSVIDEHPELSHGEVVQYLYKTWLYEENNKSEIKKTDEIDQTSLVKGTNTINTVKDKKRKKLSRKKPCDSIDNNKKSWFINQFIHQNGFQEQFQKSLNVTNEFQSIKSSSKAISQEDGYVKDNKSNNTENRVLSVVERKDEKDQNLNESTDYEPEEDMLRKPRNKKDEKYQKSNESTDYELEEDIIRKPKNKNNEKDQKLNESTDYEPEEDIIRKPKNKKVDIFESVSSSSAESESEMSLSKRKKMRKQKHTQKDNAKALMEPEFQRYLELRQDSVMDENPELSYEEVIQYLYKTWLYEENNKSEKKMTDDVDQTSLVKGVKSTYDDKDKRRKKLSRKRPSDSSDAKKKPPTIINKFLMQNGYHEHHEKSMGSDKEQEVASLNDKSHQNTVENEPDKDNDDESLNNEILNSDKLNAASSISSESDCEISLSERKQIWKEKRTQSEKKKAMMDAEFVRYLEIRQDYVMDEHPELTEEEITNYLYKTWLYEEKFKNDKKRDDEVDQTSLVKGVDFESKKTKRKYKVIKEDSQESFKVSEVIEVEPKEKSKRSAARPYYNEETADDIEEELALFEIFRKKKPNKPNVEQPTDSSQPAHEVDLTQTEEITNIEDYVYDEIDMVEMYFEQLTTPKPNVFKGLVRERVCEICEKVSNLVKCKTCHGMFHADCVKNQYKTQTEEKTPSRGRKKKKKYQRRIKHSGETYIEDDGHSDEKTQDGNSDPNLSIEAEKEPIIADAEDFEAKASAKMREILGDLDNVKYDYESTKVAISWNARPGRCQIVDVKLEIKPPEESIDASNFKCNDCEKFDTPKCFVCKSPVSPKECVEYRQKCQVAHCYKYYHLECLAHWPQTQFNGGDVRNKSKEGFEAMSCPRHVCHTCVSDDPRGCKTRFSGDKLARCVRCPATYHSFTKCLPAGSQILTGSLIICPRHYEHRPGKVPCHVNTGWCFICALGGTLICCEYCPTSFHAECLNIDPPEGGYMCEDCETGRLPLYGEMVWVKLGHYRWWPGIILHPSQIPANIMAVKHSMGEFVVRFFGQYDHYWVNRGRVFPFQEGDTGKISSQKSKIDSAFTLAVEHASRACEILKNAMPNDEESQDIASSLLPPHYVKLKVNKPVGSLVNRRIDVEESSLTQCECDPSDVEPCGPYSQCLNRMLLTECGPTCRAGERCNNRAFEKRQYPKMAPYRTPHRGWGLRCLEEIKAGQFVIEYVGELLDEAEFQRRMRRKHEVRDENFYFLTLDKERMIDAGPKGNLARFMNHSCEPNCETQKWTVLGDVRVGLFAIDDIPANSELTFNYNLESAGIEKKQCMCGAKRCSGYIGAKPKQGDPQPKKNKMVKKIQRKTKKTESPQQKRPRGRPCKPKELSEIEKDLLIIKNATSLAEEDLMANNATDSEKDTVKMSSALEKDRSVRKSSSSEKDVIKKTTGYDKDVTQLYLSASTKDLTKNNPSASEKDVGTKKSVSEKDKLNSSASSDSVSSEYSEQCDSRDKAVKRKRSSQESLTMCLKRVKTGEDEFRID